MLSKLSIGLLVLASLFGLSKPANAEGRWGWYGGPGYAPYYPPTLRIIRPTMLRTTLIGATRMAQLARNSVENRDSISIEVMPSLPLRQPLSSLSSLCGPRSRSEAWGFPYSL